MGDKELAIIKVEASSVPIVFKANGLDDLISKIKEESAGVVSDVSTPKGRKEIAARAYKIRQSKTYLDGIGKNYVAELKAIPKIVDAERKRMREELDAEAERVRRPLTEWEASEKERLETEKLAKEISEAFDQALIEDNMFDRQKELERKEAEQAAKEEVERQRAETERLAAEQKEREARIAIEAAENARKAAEESAAREKAENERKVAEAKAAEERAKREKEEAARLAEERRVREIKEAEERAAAKAKKVEDDRIEAERQRQAEIDARAANTKHKKTVNNAILAKLQEAGVDEAAGKKVIKMIVNGQIPNTTIVY